MRHSPTAKHEQKQSLPRKAPKPGPARKVHFKVKARPDSRVYIAGTFNQWNPLAQRMEPDGSGWYVASLVLPAGRHEYKFLVNGVWLIDPECPHRIPNPFGSQNHVVEI